MNHQPDHQTTDPNVRRYFVVLPTGEVWGHNDFVRIVAVHDDDINEFHGMTPRERAAYATNHGVKP